MKTLLLVGIGGGLGAMARHLVSRWTLHLANSGFPLGTFLVNVAGGLLMGLLLGWMARDMDGARELRLLLGVGFLGGFTTFSAFSVEIVQMLQKKAYALAGGYISGSVLATVLAVFGGLLLARKLFVL